MRKLQLVLPILSLILSSGCGTKYSAGKLGWNSPPCPGSYNNKTWTGCAGTRAYANGTEYVGEWQNGLYHGQGSLTYASGIKYIGVWRRGVLHGQGIKVYADGKVKEGIWENGKLLDAKKTSPTVTSQKTPPISDPEPRSPKISNNNNFQTGLDAYDRNDYATAHRKWNPLAEKGDALSQSNLGILFLEGLGVIQDYKTAFKWFRLAAWQGNASAQNNLGIMYDKGDGISQDQKTAVKWFRLAAEQGNKSAQFNLGNKYRNGGGIAQNYETAIKWYRLAAKQGSVGAQVALGTMYAFGAGVPKDYVKAYKWEFLAAANGNENAENLRDMFAKSMTYAQIVKARKLARECLKSQYKKC